MKERVKTIRGNKPTIIVVPHINDELNYMAQYIANKADFCAVINQGFKKANQVNLQYSEADCNRTNQTKKAVVFDEFLKPIIRFKDQHVKNHNSCMIYHLFETNEDVKDEQDQKNVGLIIGVGRGKKYDSRSCKSWRKHLLNNTWRQCSSLEILEGRGTGKYSGRNANEINQYFRKIQRQMSVESMEITVPKTTNGKIEKELYLAMSDMMLYDFYDKVSYSKFI